MPNRILTEKELNQHITEALAVIRLTQMNCHWCEFPLKTEDGNLFHRVCYEEIMRSPERVMDTLTARMKSRHPLFLPESEIKADA